jgi:hypothetical protein
LQFDVLEGLVTRRAHSCLERRTRVLMIPRVVAFGFLSQAASLALDCSVVQSPFRTAMESGQCSRRIRKLLFTPVRTSMSGARLAAWQSGVIEHARRFPRGSSLFETFLVA